MTKMSLGENVFLARVGLEGEALLASVKVEIDSTLMALLSCSYSEVRPMDIEKYLLWNKEKHSFT